MPEFRGGTAEFPAENLGEIIGIGKSGVAGDLLETGGGGPDQTHRLLQPVGDDVIQRRHTHGAADVPRQGGGMDPEPGGQVRGGQTAVRETFIDQGAEPFGQRIIRFRGSEGQGQNLNLKVADIPGEWNRLYKEVLGVDVPDYKRGVLQDSHWSFGGIGYFPSYALGSAYGAQMLRQMEKDTDVWETVAKGDLSPVTAWLTDKIHQYGTLKKPQDILPAAMGGPLDASVYTDYLKKKFTELYKL